MKKVYRFIALVIMAMLFTTSTVTDIHAASTKTTQPTYKDSELARAVSLGIGTYQKNTTITYKTFFKMLDKVVSLANPKALSDWGMLIYWQAKINYKYSQPFNNNFNAKKTITDILGDKEGIVW